MGLKSCLFWVVAVFAGVGALGSGEARASDAVCANPVTAAEEAICDDRHLLGLDLQINNVLYQWIAYSTGQLEDAQQMEYAHHLIEREECGSNFRCLESAMHAYLASITDFYVNNYDTIYSDYQNPTFKGYQSEASHGEDITVWNDPNNFGWSEELCKMRCAAEDRCIAVAFDIMQQGDGPPGLCVMKHKVTFPLASWTETGVFFVKPH